MNDRNINQSAMLSVGSMLRGVYRIDSYLSSGGFGNTYVATNIEFDEVVAIKEFFMKGVTQRDANNTTISVSNTENKTLFEEQLQKFKKEARRLRKMKSPHIVSVHDLFEENGTAYYVMDYIDGENLSKRLKRQQKPLSEKEVMGYLPQILDALECVHQEGIWHLDLKPANIMVDRKGNVSLIDFGASKQRSNKGGATTSTAVSFTNGFAPREQMEQNLEKFGPWTDLYALGATLYNLLAYQKPPMPSDIDDDRSADKHLALPFPPGISERTRKLILRLMTTDRLDRPQSVEEVRKLIRGVNSYTTEDTRILDAIEETIVVNEKPKEKVRTSPTPQIQEPPQRKSIKMGEPQIKVTEDDSNKSNYQVPLFLGFAAIAIIVSFLFLRGCDETNIPAAAPDPVEEIVDSAALAVEEVADSIAAAEAAEAAAAVIDEIADSAAAAVAEVAEYRNKLGKFYYSGEYNASGNPNGFGEATFDNGNYYKGPFRNGILEGENGFFKFKNGDTFRGSFKNNYFNQGTYTVAGTGEYFVGTFNKGEPQHGTWYDKNGNTLETK